MGQKKKNIFKVLGPGIIVAATGIGAGDLIAAAVSGAQYGYALLWAALVGAILKYVLNEGIFRDVVNKAKNFYNSVKNIVKGFYENIIKRFFKQLYELAKQGITVLLDALGLEISKAEVSMATPSW